MFRKNLLPPSFGRMLQFLPKRRYPSIKLHGVTFYKAAVLIFIAVRTQFIWYRAVFLKLSSAEPQGPAKGCQEFRETKMRDGGRVYWRSYICMYELQLAWRHQKLIVLSLTARSQPIAASYQKLLNSAVQSSPVSTARRRQSMCQAKRSVYRSVWG